MPFHEDVHETMMQEHRKDPCWDLYEAELNPCDRACDDREAMERAGYDCDCTPVDILMGDPGLGFNVAHAMEHGDDEPDT